MYYLSNMDKYRWIILLWTSFFPSLVTFALEIPPSVRRPPRIIRQPHDQIYHILPGVKTVLPCEADANPAVEFPTGYHWKKDGKRVKVNRLHSGRGSLELIMPGPHGSVTFSEPGNSSSAINRDFEGTYQCFAKNKWGTALSTKAVVRIGTTPPFITPEDDEITVALGDPLIKPCVRPDGNSNEVGVNWQFKTDDFEKSNRIAQAPDGSIIFSNVVSSDNGLVFYCSWKYLATRTSIDSIHHTIRVTNDVEFNDKSAQIVYPKSNEASIVVMRGEDFSLPCIATGHPTPSVYWSSENRFEAIDFNRTLVIKNVQYSDEGTYICSAENALNSVARKVKLIVESKPYFADETMKPFDTVVEPASNVIVTCEPAGTPAPEITWMKNGKILTGSHFHGKSRVPLNDLNEDDTAVYQCIGTNKHGTTMAQGFINVLATPPVAMPNNTLLYRKLEGTAVDITCAMFPPSGVTVVWTKSNQPQKNLLRDNRISQTTDSTLVIQRINVDDEDIYTCNATNKYGSAHLAINLTVLSPTTIQPNSEKYSVARGDRIALEVKVTTDRNAVIRSTWTKKNGRRMGTGNALEIVDAKLSDSGIYVFEVQTELDQRSVKFDLTVTDVPSPPFDVQFQNDTGYNGTLSWKTPLFDGHSPITGYHVDVNASNDLVTGEWRRYNSTSGMEQCTIVGLKPWVRYSFRVWAENDVGKSLQASTPTPTHLTPAKAPEYNPNNVSGIGSSGDTMVISWNPLSPFEHSGPGFGYAVRWCLLANCSWKEEFVTRDKSTYTVRDTPSYSDFRIAVRSDNNIGKGPEPESFKGRSGYDYPAAPDNFKVMESSLTDIKLKWNEPVAGNGEIIGFVLTYDWEENGEKKSNTSYTKDGYIYLNGLTPNTSFVFTLCVETIAGIGLNCSRMTAKTVAPRKPEKPVATVSANSDSFVVTWRDSTRDENDGIPISGYIVQHRITDAANVVWTTSKRIPATGRGMYNFTITKTSLNGPYELRVLAKNKYGISTSDPIDPLTKGYPISSGGVAGQLWLIMILCIIALVVLILLVVCFIRRRRGGHYPVSEKEEELVKSEAQLMKSQEGGKYSLSRTNGLDNDVKEVDETTQNGQPRLRGSSVGGDSIEAFGNGNTREYEEDGSFIDQYGLEPNSESKSSTPLSPDNDSGVNSDPSMATNSRQEAV